MSSRSTDRSLSTKPRACSCCFECFSVNRPDWKASWKGEFRGPMLLAETSELSTICKYRTWTALVSRSRDSDQSLRRQSLLQQLLREQPALQLRRIDPITYSVAIRAISARHSCRDMRTATNTSLPFPSLNKDTVIQSHLRAAGAKLFKTLLHNLTLPM